MREKDDLDARKVQGHGEDRGDVNETRDQEEALRDS